MFKKLFLLLPALALAFVATAQQEVREINIQADATETPEVPNSSLDRITWDRQLQAGHDYAIVFPAPLDGYYFGADAQRYEVRAMAEQNGVWHLNIADPMTDLQNFLPGQPVYLVRPTVDIAQLTFVTAGIRTNLLGRGWQLRCIDVTGYVVDTELAIRHILTAADTETASAWYDIMGRQVSFGAAPTEPGTYINRGQKVIIK